MKTTWRARPDRHWLQREWNGDAVIYDPLSGSTHYLDSVAVAVLGCLKAEPAACDAIARSLCTESDAEGESDVLANVQEALAKLKQMDLIQPADV